MHIEGIENLMKGIMLWFTFVLNSILNMLKNYLPEPLGLTLFFGIQCLFNLFSFIYISFQRGRFIFLLRHIRASSCSFFCFYSHVFYFDSRTLFTVLEQPNEIQISQIMSLLLHIIMVIIAFLFDGRIVPPLMTLGSLKKNSVTLILTSWRVIYALPRGRREFFQLGEMMEIIIRS